MDINSFTKSFADLFEETDPSAFTDQTIFRDIEEWDSLIALSIIAMVDEEFDVKVTGDDIRNSKSIIDVFNIVKQKV